MDAILGHVFLSVVARIKARCPEIRWIDQDFGQLEVHGSERPEVLFPCVLIDIVDVPYTDMGENSQLATPTLVVKLGFAPYTNSAAVHSQTHIEKAIDFYNIEHRLNQALHGWCNGQYFTELTRKHVRTEKGRPDIRVRPLRYEFSFEDDTAMKIPFETIGRPDLQININPE